MFQACNKNNIYSEMPLQQSSGDQENTCTKMKPQYIRTSFYPTLVASHFPLARLTYKTSIHNKYVS